jgi:hypothetical protein
MDPPKRPTRPIVLLALVCLLCILARIQLGGMDSLSLQHPLHSFVDSDRAAWAFVMLVLAVGAATAVAFAARDRLNFLLVVGFSGAVGGIVLARIDPMAGMVFRALAAELVIFPPLRQVMAEFLVAGASLVYGTVAAAFALATQRDIVRG